MAKLKEHDKKIDFNGSFTYIGEAAPGTTTEESLWRIKRIQEFTDGDMNILWANGTDDYIMNWHDRNSYNYMDPLIQSTYPSNSLYPNNNLYPG